MLRRPWTSDEPARRAGGFGRRGWRRERAGRVGVAIDGEDYFSVLRDIFRRAQRSILIVGWDIHGEVSLRRDAGGMGETLGDLLVSLVRERRRLRAHLLVWDFAMIYATERELLPVFSRWWRMPRGLIFRYDDRHPVGASHHQKIVVVDDSVACVGGLDLTARRWDSREHRAADARRIDPWGGSYGPFHDVQMIVDGDAAAAVADLVRARWRRLGGRAPTPVEKRWRGDRWPAEAAVLAEDVPVTIARTLAPWDDERGVHEIEDVYLDAIAAARRTIYIENQYFTSHAVADALATRLREANGPEVVLVGPESCTGWLEEKTMGTRRAQHLARLDEADVYGRLHAYCPYAPDDPTTPVKVHSKLMIVDDRYLHVGSANLSNRSMMLDSECDLGLEAERPEVATGVEAVRDGLLAEHLHVSSCEVTDARRATGRLSEAIERLRSRHDTLRPLEPLELTTLDELLPAVLPVDPEQPIGSDAFTDFLWPSGSAQERGGSRWPALVGFGLVVGLAGLWRYTALSQLATPDRIAVAARDLQTTWWGPVAGALGLAGASVAMVPVTALVVASGIVFGAWRGFVVALAGAVLGAIAGHQLGRWLWRDAIRRLAGRRTNRLARRLRTGGVTSVVIVRMVPVAPFAVVNLAAGATHIRLGDFVAGTVIGLAPGACLLTLAGDGAMTAIRNPTWGAVGMVALALLGFAMLGLVYRSIARRRSI